MKKEIDGQQIRKVLLEVVDEYSQIGPGYFQTNSVLRKVSKQLGLRGNLEFEQALLTIWHDLFRTGYLAWGHNLNNPDPPFCHLTDQSRKTLENLSQDPANPDGYLTHLAELVTLNPIAKSYLDEALKTYNLNCFKAAAVMIGAAAESIVLELRDTLSGRIRELGRSPTRDLADWRIKKVLNAIQKELDSHKRNMSRKLAEAFEAYWPAFTHQVRVARNEAGHPSSIEPVTRDTVHASMLIFPELAKLASDLKAWIVSDYA